MISSFPSDPPPHLLSCQSSTLYKVHHKAVLEEVLNSPENTCFVFR
uniref:Uncharacterized protein n=1 Tax=Anguilla anguilla TaxID=7936 RepID=A0A0E9PCL2_ANGAN